MQTISRSVSSRTKCAETFHFLEWISVSEVLYNTKLFRLRIFFYLTDTRTTSDFNWLNLLFLYICFHITRLMHIIFLCILKRKGQTILRIRTLSSDAQNFLFWNLERPNMKINDIHYRYCVYYFIITNKWKWAFVVRDSLHSLHRYSKSN